MQKITEKIIEKKNAPKIAIIICHPGKVISNILEINLLIENLKKIPDVVYVDEINCINSDNTHDNIIYKIKKKNVNRILFVEYSLNISKEFSTQICERSGINKYLIEFLNIKEHCIDENKKDIEKNTRNLIIDIKMALAKLRLQEASEDLKFFIEKSSLIIGGGISGLSAALSLANQGFNVHLIEKKDKLGGMLNNLYKLYPNDIDAEDLIQHMILEVVKNKKIRIYLSTSLKKVDGYIGNLKIFVENQKSGGVKHFHVGTIIVATGAGDRNPGHLYDYPKYENVITQFELENSLKKHKLNILKRVVMIQCVGARGQGVLYCSKICCMNAIKNAVQIKELFQDCEIFILHRDIQAYGKEYEEYYRNARIKGIKFIRFDLSRIPQISKMDNKKLCVNFFNSILGKEMNIKSDLVVLSTPLIQNEQNLKLTKTLGIELNKDNYFLETQPKLKPVEFFREGIYFCGTANSPMDIKESITQAIGVASKSAILLGNDYFELRALFPKVDLDLCKGCGICEMVCPYYAMKIIDTEKGRRAELTPSLCKGCGCCGSSCIWNAITLENFTDEQIRVQYLTALEEG